VDKRYVSFFKKKMPRAVDQELRSAEFTSQVMSVLKVFEFKMILKVYH
jgi:hypothetical protein